MLILLLPIIAIYSVNSRNEYHHFYAINPKMDQDLSIFERLEDCPIWNSTTDSLFLHKNPDDKHWYLTVAQGGHKRFSLSQDC